MSIAVLLSGGVDSSVALRLLRDAGHDDLTAFYLKIWLEDELAFLGDCPWEEDLAYARAVCAAAEVPLEIVPLQREYHERVVNHTIAELRAGRTPSPDILCNQRIKYGAFREVVGTDFAHVASGHYARVEFGGGRHHLHKGVDPVKDQTYFLSHLSQEQLGRCLFPVGDLPKPAVRALAERFELPNRARPDSQGICFLGKIRYNDFVRSHLGVRPGEIRERETGRKLGHHSGFWFHTIGQRKGLGLSGGPWFVVAKDCHANVVYVSHQEHVDHQSRSRFEVGRIHWLNEPAPADALQVKLRHSEHVYDCTLAPAASAERSVVQLAGEDAGVAAGQYAVFYRGTECLGGAVIAE
ncbi:MAG: tRNA 2-thiouridine(34) synthase MnmA [Planctomycetota bacterium]